jgi:mitochondrial fission protein ELM1
VSDGEPGKENQSVGLAEAMGFVPVVKRFCLGKTWRELALRLNWNPRPALVRQGIEPPWPDVLVGTGRTSVVASLYVKHASGGRTFTVQIQKPPVPSQRFDHVIVPEHDRLLGDNVITMTGGLHRLSPERMKSETAKWIPCFAHLPHPWVAVLIGGTNAFYRLGPREIADLCTRIAGLAREQTAGLLITASRRTGAGNVERLRTFFRNCPAVLWCGNGENPYYGMLGAADSFIVTCDSINMISEACATGKPVQMIALPGRSRKFDAFHQSLIASGRLRMFDGRLEHWQYEPLRERERVATFVRRSFEARRLDAGP